MDRQHWKQVIDAGCGTGIPSSLTLEKGIA